MHVSVETPTKLERRLTVTVPAEVVEEAYNKRIKRLAETEKAKGYRPGKIPLSVAKQLFDGRARQESLSEVIQSSLYAAIDQEKLSPAGTPMVEPMTMAPEQPLQFTATFEVVPVVESVQFEMKTIEKQRLVMTEADLENALNRLRQQSEQLDEEFVKKLGIKSGKLEDLTTEIRKNLEREGERIGKAKLKNQLFDQLIEQNKIDIPKSLIEREAKRIHDELHPHHAGQDHGHSAAEMAVFNEPAKRNVTLGLLIGYLIKQHNMMVDKERVQASIEKLAAVYEQPAEAIAFYETNKRARAEVEFSVLEDQVVEKLLENTTLTEKTVSYQELMAA